MSSDAEEVEESWQQVAKYRKKEKQEEVKFESLFWLLESPFHQSGSHFISLQVPKSTEFMKIEHA